MAEKKKVEIVQKLNETRAILLDFFAGLGDAAWQTAVYHEEAHWTIADILRHLVDAERGMTELMKRWKNGENPVPPDFDLARWNNRVIQKAAEKNPPELLQDLETNREALLEFIGTIQPEDWSIKGRHGSLRVMTIEEVCHLIADHERSHLAAMR